MCHLLIRSLAYWLAGVIREALGGWMQVVVNALFIEEMLSAPPQSWCAEWTGVFFFPVDKQLILQPSDDQWRTEGLDACSSR